MKAPRIITSVLSAALAIAAGCHIALLASDSDAYRRWVYIQMTLLAASAVLLWLSRGSRSRLLVGAVAVGVPAIYINHVYLNYGGPAAVWLVPSAVAVGVVSLAVHQRGGRGARPN